MVSGGISGVEPPMIHIHLVLGLALAVVAIYRLFKSGFPTGLAAAGTYLVVLAFALVLLQLVPVPPGVWKFLPMRDLVMRNLALSEAAPGWMPISLSPEATRQCLEAMVPATAAFLAALTLRARNAWPIPMALLLAATIGVGFALLQRLNSGSNYYLYDPDWGIGSGTFNNQNFFAAQIYTALPLLGMVLALATTSFNLRLIISAPFALFLAVILLTGLALSGSRTGIVLAMLGLASAVVLARGAAAASRRSLSMLGLGAALFGAWIVGQASMFGFMRFATQEAFANSRGAIWQTSTEVLKSVLPFGSGLGSFLPIYQTFESPADLQGAVVNHVHNDWLELAIETGAFGIMLMLAFLIWFALAIFRVWRYGSGPQTANLQRAATIIIALLLLHSLVDFPLRTPALLSFFGLCCGLCCVPPISQRSHDGAEARRNKQQPRPHRPGVFSPGGSNMRPSADSRLQ